MAHFFLRPMVAFVVSIAASLGMAASTARADDDAYLRIVDDEKVQKATLEVAVRTFTPKAAGPTVLLVGAVHIGDQAYYDGLQTFLDAQDLVLFEGVKPGAMMPPGASADDASRIKITKQRVRFLGVLVEQYRLKNNALPSTFAAAMDGEKGPSAQMARAALVDGWGNAVALRVEGKKKFDVVSLGSDGTDGGADAAADIKLSDMDAITKEETKAEEGIQVKLAKALKLEFQLAAMDYSKANWRNSDMTVEELTRRLNGGEEGDEGDGEGKQSALMGMLSGQSFGAKVVGFLLKIIEVNPSLSAMTKLMMLEMLGKADEIMEAQGSALMGVGGEQFMKVLIDDRNEVVLEDLRGVLKESPEVKTIAIFYGAGHLPKMQKSLIDAGYTAGETAWRPAIVIDLKEFPGGASAAKASRAMIKKQLDSQLKKK